MKLLRRCQNRQDFSFFHCESVGLLVYSSNLRIWHIVENPNQHMITCNSYGFFRWWTFYLESLWNDKCWSDSANTINNIVINMRSSLFQCDISLFDWHCTGFFLWWEYTAGKKTQVESIRNSSEYFYQPLGRSKMICRKLFWTRNKRAAVPKDKWVT